MQSVTSASFDGAEMITCSTDSSQMARGLVLGRETARRLHDDLHAEVAPGNLRGVGMGEDPQLFAVDEDRRLHADFVRNRAVHGVVFQQVGQRRGVGEIVARHELDIRILRQRGADDIPSDPPETIDSNTYHGILRFDQNPATLRAAAQFNAGRRAACSAARSITTLMAEEVRPLYFSDGGLKYWISGSFRTRSDT